MRTRLLWSAQTLLPSGMLDSAPGTCSTFSPTGCLSVPPFYCMAEVSSLREDLLPFRADLQLKGVTGISLGASEELVES